MSFTIITDTSANLPAPLLAENHVDVIPFSYIVNGKAHTCLDTESFDGERYYADIKAGLKVTTSQITPQRYIDCMTPHLERGEDILFVGMSSGISGAYGSAVVAAKQLRETFPKRRLRLVDTLAASLGEGIFVLRAIELRAEGKSIDEAAEILLARRQMMYQTVVLDDLMYLHRGGRVSVAKALIGTVLGIRPILKGNAAGELIVCGKVRGRKAGIAELARRYKELADEPENKTVGIAYTGSPEDAQKLAETINVICPPKKLYVVCYEPVTGSHVGPGTVALFFEGRDGVREF